MKAMELNISKDMVRITANTPAGWFYALQTIRQLLPPDAELGTTQKGLANCCRTIRDYPEYTYRGSMLDVARHFFSVEDVKRYIDLIAAYKMNILHLHLSDDQGWRIEIKSWPNLTSIGGSTEVGGAKGFLHAGTIQRHCKICPGPFCDHHSRNRYAGAYQRRPGFYPELHSIDSSVANLQKNMEQHKETDTAINLYTGTEVGFSTLRTHKEITYKFIDDVIRELAAITPGPWIHIGGDESHVTSKKITFLCNESAANGSSTWQRR